MAGTPNKRKLLSENARLVPIPVAPKVARSYQVVHQMVASSRVEPVVAAAAAAVPPSPTGITMNQVDDLFRAMFPTSQWRPLQRQIIESVISGKNTLGILPTGGGKTATYMIPAKLLAGPVVVISPLKALMEDQVEIFREKGVHAACLHGDTKALPARGIWSDLSNGTLKVLLISPEKLGNEKFLWNIQELQRVRPISLLVCDEVHCIDEWGANFRPDFHRINHFFRRFCFRATFLAVTATATVDVITELQQTFTIDSRSVFRGSLYRPNLRLECFRCASIPKMQEMLAYRLHSSMDLSIIYCTAKDTTTELANNLYERIKLSPHPFHARLPLATKRDVMTKFHNAHANMVICATTAFGMGIDKANIRNIYHFKIPRSVESYVQAIGRAGRDNLPATCVTFYTLSYVDWLRRNAEQNSFPLDQLRNALRKVFNSPVDVKAEFTLDLSELVPKAFTKGLYSVLTRIELVDKYFEQLGVLIKELSSYRWRPVDGINLQRELLSPAAKFIASLRTETNKKYLSTLDFSQHTGSVFSRQELLNALFDMEKKNLIEISDSSAKEKKGNEIPNNGTKPKKRKLLRYRRTRPPPTSQELEQIVHREYTALRNEAARVQERQLKLVDILTNPQQCVTQSLLLYFGDRLPNGRTRCEHCFYCGQNPFRGY